MIAPEVRAIRATSGIRNQIDPLDLPALEDAIADEIREAVEEAAAVRWIPVGERLPVYVKEGKNTYLVLYKLSEGMLRLTTGKITHQGVWVDPILNSGGGWCDRIQYWMPYPDHPAS